MRDGPVLELEVESIDLDANGVAHHEGKVVFVRDALPGERVRAQVVRRKPRFDVAQTEQVLRGSVARVAPRCPHFGVCGGCSMQHLEPRTQLAIKQRALEDQLWHLGRVRPGTVLRPIAGPTWSYRYRARLSVRHVAKKGGVLVGFHERGSSYVADMHGCAVMPPRVSDLIDPLRTFIGTLDMRDRMPQIEVALGEVETGEVLALVFRVLEPPTDRDRAALIAFARTHAFELWFQPKGPDTVHLVWAPHDDEAQAPSSRLAYTLPEFDVRMPFRPTDFTQVNHRVNEMLVAHALRLLQPQPDDRVADMFCGLGNFSLPLARRARAVVGVEGSATLVARATENARANGLSGRATFQVANLFEVDDTRWRALGPFDRVLIDPPREGALELAKALSSDPHKPERIVYVSCNPATLARDAGVLVHTGGFTLLAAGAVNMFPHTSHVESIAVFVPADPAVHASQGQE
ncbi:MAG TPA: 23S rRNA (uracil(1939)-C(5))-methyltransferase RlmD [Quisquiliibacterium sp.]|nr:MAG: 23S rRNA (uracil(1939)-C(5))-methyltransferase RlmD [Burkholderiaceae bacterium]HQP66153.1 23S rRNA (uracil(1939)-C(5))-methyltransferase RlmD [Quisquiliibacterium sp.]